MNDDREFTNNWWSALLKDEERLQKWLIKLESTERQGFQDNLDAIENYTKNDQPSNVIAEAILQATASDELRHADMLEKILTIRDPTWKELPAPASSTYWAEMYAGINDLSSCAAAFSLGEGLAAERFEVLQCHPETPSDIKWFLDNALPDEQHHHRIFTKLAGKDALSKMIVRHNAAVNYLKNKNK